MRAFIACLNRDFNLIVTTPRHFFLPLITIGLTLFLITFSEQTLSESAKVSILTAFVVGVILSSGTDLTLDYERGFIDALKVTGTQKSYLMAKISLTTLLWTMVLSIAICGILQSLSWLYIITALGLVLTITSLQFSLQGLCLTTPIQGQLIYLMGAPLILPSYLMSTSLWVSSSPTILTAHLGYGVLILLCSWGILMRQVRS